MRTTPPATKFDAFWPPHSLLVAQFEMIVFDIFARGVRVGVASQDDWSKRGRILGMAQPVIYCRRQLALINYAFV